MIKTTEVAAALTLEALLGISDAFDERIHMVRPHDGQAVTVRNVRELIAGSQLVQTGKEAMEKLQRPHDPYSLRCAPQVLGAARDAIAYTKEIVEVEINSATDNPLVFPEDETCLSGGNFHGQPVSLAMDLLGVSLTIVGNISERRTARLDEKLNNGLPAFLIPPEAKKGIKQRLDDSAVHSHTALISGNKVLAHPACVDSIPTSANFEDFVSMEVTAAQKAVQILENVEYIVAIRVFVRTPSNRISQP